MSNPPPIHSPLIPVIASRSTRLQCTVMYLSCTQACRRYACYTSVAVRRKDRTKVKIPEDMSSTCSGLRSHSLVPWP